jgi:exocyst complex component 1
MMVHVEFYLRDYHNTCHLFIVNLLESLHKRVDINFEKFVNEQIVKLNNSRKELKRGKLQVRSAVVFFPL